MDEKEIDDKIDEWHNGLSELSLPKFLGMTDSEYKRFVENRNNKNNVKIGKCLTISLTQDKIAFVIKSGFTKPQLSYVIRESPYENPLSTHSAIPYVMEELMFLTKLSEQEIIDAFK